MTLHEESQVERSVLQLSLLVIGERERNDMAVVT